MVGCTVTSFRPGSVGGDVDLTFQQPATTAADSSKQVTQEALVSSFDVQAAQTKSGNLSILADRLAVSGKFMIKLYIHDDLLLESLACNQRV